MLDKSQGNNPERQITRDERLVFSSKGLVPDMTVNDVLNVLWDGVTPPKMLPRMKLRTLNEINSRHNREIRTALRTLMAQTPTEYDTLGSLPEGIEPDYDQIVHECVLEERRESSFRRLMWRVFGEPNYRPV